ncbi:hypothetical protein NL676_019045 [Syzygium grande]|nr:hypothetical protein NL676_019045 [Syzygium grande]
MPLALGRACARERASERAAGEGSNPAAGRVTGFPPVRRGGPPTEGPETRSPGQGCLPPPRVAFPFSANAAARRNRSARKTPLPSDPNEGDGSFPRQRAVGRSFHRPIIFPTTDNEYGTWIRLGATKVTQKQ